MNPGTSGECGAWTNLNWGQQGQTTTVNPDVLEGWGKRNCGLAVQRRRPARDCCRASRSTSSYSRRRWGNFFVTQNRALTAADYDEVTLTAPLDPRLPGGGGYPVSFLVRNNHSVLGATDPYYTADTGLRRRDALLARRRCDAERAAAARA